MPPSTKPKTIKETIQVVTDYEIEFNSLSKTSRQDTIDLLLRVRGVSNYSSASGEGHPCAFRRGESRLLTSSKSPAKTPIKKK